MAENVSFVVFLGILIKDKSNKSMHLYFLSWLERSIKEGFASFTDIIKKAHRARVTKPRWCKFPSLTGKMGTVIFLQGDSFSLYPHWSANRMTIVYWLRKLVLARAPYCGHVLCASDVKCARDVNVKETHALLVGRNRGKGVNHSLKARDSFLCGMVPSIC